MPFLRGMLPIKIILDVKGYFGAFILLDLTI
jgi:hypothetical protein